MIAGLWLLGAGCWAAVGKAPTGVVASGWLVGAGCWAVVGKAP